jgi:heterodisulfide reductase subunit B
VTKISYYPGCSLDGTAIEYNASLQRVAKILGFELEELPDWTCCGSSSAHVSDDKLALSLAENCLIGHAAVPHPPMFRMINWLYL